MPQKLLAKLVATYYFHEETINIFAMLNDITNTAEYYDLFDQSGSCLNEGDPWYPPHKSGNTKFDSPPSFEEVKEYLGFD